MIHLLVRLQLSQRRLNPPLHSWSEKSHWQCFSLPKEKKGFTPGVAAASMAANSQPQAMEGGGGRSARGSSSFSAPSATPGVAERSPASTAATWYFLFLNQIGLNTTKTLHLAPTSSTKFIPLTHEHYIFCHFDALFSSEYYLLYSILHSSPTSIEFFLTYRK